MLLFVCAFLSMLAWALATPVGGYENDETTLTNIYCSRAPNDLCQPDPTDSQQFLIPKAFSRASFEKREYFFCHVTSPDKKTKDLPSARCLYNYQDPNYLNLENSLSATRNFPLYPSLFATVMGSLASENLIKTIFYVRIVNISSCLLIFALLYKIAGAKKIEQAFVPWLIFMPSFGMFLLSGNTRSTWSVLGVGSAWLFIERTFNSKILTIRIFSIAGLAISFVLGTGSRWDSLFFTLLSIVVGLLLARGELFIYLRKKATVVLIGLFVSLTIIGTMALNLEYARSISFAILKNLFKSTSIAEFPNWFMSRGVYLPEIFLGAFGGNNGEENWQTAAPPFALVLNLISLGLVFTKLMKNQFSEHKGVKIFLILLVLAVSYSNDLNNLGAKTRYILPLAVLIVGVMTYSKENAPSLTTKEKLLLSSTLGTSYFLSLYAQISRYVQGPSHRSWNLNGSPQWWWSKGPSPMSTLIIGSGSFFILCILVLGVSSNLRRNAHE